jgi:ATP-dependent exoDNAse (exonuclease V) beta subunit
MKPRRYVVLDELQDLTEDLYWVINTFISAVTRAIGRAPQILALGDARQAIYEFRGADARFLDLSPTVYSAVSPYEWEALALSKSFRLSQETASFVNNAFLGGEQYIEGLRSGEPKPLYVNANLGDIKTLLKLILPLVRQYG